MQPQKVVQVIDRQRYNTETATLLYRTPKGAYFFQHLSQWQGDPGSRLEPCSESEAYGFWEACEPHQDSHVDVAGAFPSMVITDA